MSPYSFDKNLLVLSIFIYIFVQCLVASNKFNGTLDCACGDFLSTGKAIDGISVSSGEFPWLIGIIKATEEDNNNVQPLCYGTIINDRYAISAASCFTRKRPEDISIFFFGANVAVRRKRSVDKIILHENYNRTNHDNNLALLRLSKPLNLQSQDQNISPKPICLPNEEIPSKELLRTQGLMAVRRYYKSAFYGSTSYYFASLPVPIIQVGEDNCTNIFSARSEDPVCYDEHGSHCYGELGSMLTMKTDYKYVAIGVYSKGYGCRGYMGTRPADVSTDVSKYVTWIMHHSSDGNFCKQ